MKEQLTLLPQYLLAHLQLTLVALAFGIGLSVPLGIVLTRRRHLQQTALGIASVIQTIPALALLAVMVPLLGAAGLTSIGYLPAIIALTLYSVLPILRNTVIGISEVDPALTEAARGVGMTDWQTLMRVELPVALPIIVAGIRTATVWTVGMATLSTPIGAPSLGNYIFSGLQTRNYASVLVGCLASAALALILDGLIRTIEVGVRERRKAMTRGAIAVLALLCVVTGGSAIQSISRSAGQNTITIGAKTFTEQYILSAIIAAQVHNDTGLPAKLMQSLGSTVAFDALRTGQIDTYVEYSGTIWATLMKRKDVPQNRGDVLTGVDTWLREQHAGIVVGSLGFENTYALAMRADQALALGIKTISDLGIHARRLTIGGDYEFFQRNEWKSIQETYGLSFTSERSMDPSLMYQALTNGDVDVISAFSTDGRLAALNLTVLTDDRGVIPPYDAIILASERLSREYPEIITSLKALAGKIDPEHMRLMNLAVDRDHRTPPDVAEEFIDSIGIR